MAQMYIYNTSESDTCYECGQWDGQTGTAEELPQTPNPDCYNGSCNCYLEEIDGGEDCEAQGLLDCVDQDDFPFCGEEGDEGCGDEGCWCTTGIDPQTGNDDFECDSPYWDPNCLCSDECDDRDE